MLKHKNWIRRLNLRHGLINFGLTEIINVVITKTPHDFGHSARHENKSGIRQSAIYLEDSEKVTTDNSLTNI